MIVGKIQMSKNKFQINPKIEIWDKIQKSKNKFQINPKNEI